MVNSIEDLWNELLSRDPIRIKNIFEDLGDRDRQAVIDHLKTMTSEEGWHSTQKRSARIALKAIEKLIK
jgi:hypothetical protein